MLEQIPLFDNLLEGSFNFMCITSFPVTPHTRLANYLVDGGELHSYYLLGNQPWYRLQHRRLAYPGRRVSGVYNVKPNRNRQ